MTAPLLLIGCDSISVCEPAPIYIPLIHRVAAVLQVLSIRAGNERAEVAARIINGRDRAINLDGGHESSYLLTDAGEKLMLVPSSENAKLSVPAGQTFDVTLVFEGTLSGDEALLILNEQSGSDNTHTINPRFETRLPLNGAGSGAVAEQSALSGMRPNVASSLRARGAGESGFGGTERSTSELRAVEA